MKKLDRLRRIEETFGVDYVLPYQACLSMDAIENTAVAFDRAGKTWGMRTDFRNGAEQGFNLPFLQKGTISEARRIYSEHGHSLVYIVSENILKYRLNAVAMKIDKDHVFFEWNLDPDIPQRKMYDNLSDIRRIAVGPSGAVLAFGEFFRCVSPEVTSWYRFDKVYDVLVHSEETEATFSVRDDGKLVIW